jgi:hypothetical protein
MNRIHDRIDRRTALVQLTAATMLAAGPAQAQRPDPSLAEIKITDLGRKTYMLEGQGGNILVVIGDDGIIMVDAELAPLHDGIKAAITRSSNLPIKYLVVPISMASRPAGMRRSIVTAPSSWRRTMCGSACLQAPPTASTTTRAHRRTRMRSRPKPMSGASRPWRSVAARRGSPMPPTRTPMGTAGFIWRTPTPSSRAISLRAALSPH